MENQAKLKESRGMVKEVSAWRMRVRVPMLVYPLREPRKDTWQVSRREPITTKEAA